MVDLIGLKGLLFAALGCVTAYFLWIFIRSLRAKAEDVTTRALRPHSAVLGISFVATFFDALGIGSFAPTTTMFRHWKLVADELMPGTLNIGYVVPTVAEAYIYTRFVPVGIQTLIAMIGASALGAWLGAGIVARWSRRRIQIGMGMALLIAATIMVFSQPQVGLLPAGGEAFHLSGWKLAVGVAGNFVLGALMTCGVGLYAPCMMLVYLLGMAPTAAFPIMMGSCAFLMPVASVRFIKAQVYSPSAVVGMTLTGIPAVLIAAYIVKSLPLTGLRWLVIVVVSYAATSLLRASRVDRGDI